METCQVIKNVFLFSLFFCLCVVGTYVYHRVGVRSISPPEVSGIMSCDCIRSSLEKILIWSGPSYI